MPSIATQPARLTAHASTPNDAVLHLGVQLRATSDILEFHYSLDVDLSRIRIPLAGVGGRADALWKHTCFEAFVAPEEAPGYYEFNFSPSLDWAIYQFSAYRDGMSPAAIGQAPTLSVHRGGNRLELQSAVSMGHLADLRDARHLRVALAAVIEDENGRLSYWGLRHAPGKPDFHHPIGFALKVVRA